MGKGRYSGLLVCTDFDCTLAHNGKVSEENLDAIARFQQGGGRLTLATGRYPWVLKDYGIPLRCNAPLICMNGAILYDESEDRYLYEGTMEESCHSLLLRAMRECRGIRDVVFCLARTRDTRHVEPDDLVTMEHLCGESLYKILIHVSEEDCLQLRDSLRTWAEGRFLIDRSWHSGVEIQGIGYNKGRTARRLAKHLGADELICIGDFDNDLSMIAEADRSFAVENATDEIKEAADRIVPASWDNGFAYMIDSL